MSETNTNPNKQPVKFTKGAKVAGAVLALTGAVVAAEAPNIADHYKQHNAQITLENNLQRPDALEEYLKGDQIPHDKAVRMVAPHDMPPAAFATEIEKKADDQWELTQQIRPQADFHLDPGLQGGEQVVVEKSLVSDDAIKMYGVGDVQDSPVK